MISYPDYSPKYLIATHRPIMNPKDRQQPSHFRTNRFYVIHFVM